MIAGVKAVHDVKAAVHDISLASVKAVVHDIAGVKCESSAWCASGLR